MSFDVCVVPRDQRFNLPFGLQVHGVEKGEHFLLLGGRLALLEPTLQAVTFVRTERQGLQNLFHAAVKAPIAAECNHYVFLSFNK